MSSTATQVVQLAPNRMFTRFSAMIASLESNFADPRCVPTLDEVSQLFAELDISNGNTDDLFGQIHDMSSAYFVAKMLITYLEELKYLHAKLNKLAFDYSHSKVLVWAEVADEDEVAMEHLIIAEAKANADSFDREVFMSTTVVEKSDHISIPPHYIPFHFSSN